MSRILYILLVVFLGPVVFGHHVEAQVSLELEIVSDKPFYVLGEPVILIVSLKNTGNAPAEVVPTLDPVFDYVQYRIKDLSATGEAGEGKLFRPYWLEESSEPKKTLAPGEMITGNAKIFYGSEGWTFKKAGEYTVKAVYGNQIESNTLTIKVIQPSRGDAREAARKFISSDEVGRFLFLEGGDHLKEALRILEDVVVHHPQAPHAVSANFVLGVRLSHDFENVRENLVRKADPDRASRYLNKVDSVWSNYYSPEAAVRLAPYYFFYKIQPDKATEVLNELRNDIKVRVPDLQTRRLIVESLKAKGFEVKPQ